MTLRTVTIWTTGMLLLTLFLYSGIHWIMLNAVRVKNDPDFWFMLPGGMLALTSLTGWPFVVTLAIAQFVKHHVAGTILLSSTIIYGVMVFVVLIAIDNSDPRTISGLAYLFFPITVSVYVLLPLWLIAFFVEVYHRIKNRKSKTEP